MKQEYKLLSSGANCDSCVKYVLLNREIGRYKNDNLSIILVKKLRFLRTHVKAYIRSVSR